MSKVVRETLWCNIFFNPNLERERQTGVQYIYILEKKPPCQPRFSGIIYEKCNFDKSKKAGEREIDFAAVSVFHLVSVFMEAK